MDWEKSRLDLGPGGARSAISATDTGAYIYHFNSAKQIDGQIRLPEALIPHSPVGTINFLADPPINGRRVSTRGWKGSLRSPDGTRLFGLLQSTTHPGFRQRQPGPCLNARLVVYDLHRQRYPQ